MSAQSDVSPEPSDVTVRFMLSEMERTSKRWAHADQMAESRLNVLVTITSGASGILLLLSQLKTAVSDFLAVALVVFAAVWLLGLITFIRILERDLTVVGYIRAINRARRFFVDNAPSIQKYLAFPAVDSEPKYTRLGARVGLRTVSEIICSLAFGLLWGDIYSLVAFGSQVSAPSFVIGIVIFSLHLGSMKVYSSSRLRNAEKRYEVRFPSE